LGGYCAALEKGGPKYNCLMVLLSHSVRAGAAVRGVR